jgi:hypothetical protein
MVEDSEVWRSLSKEFDHLAKRETDLLVGRSPDPTLRAFCSYGTGHPEFGHIRLEGGVVPRLKTEFQEIATRAGRYLNCPSAVRPFEFWIHCLCKDCFESGNHAGIIGPPECRIVQGIIEKSALYGLRLAIAADEAAHKEGASAPNLAGNAKTTLPEPKDELNLTDDQHKEIDQAEKQLSDSFRAHEELRGVLESTGWVAVGPQRPGAPTMAEDFQKLERDINEYAIKVIRVIGRGLSPLGGVELFSERLKTCARDIREHVIAKIDLRDLPNFDQSVLDGQLKGEVESWIRKARQEFPPSWLPPPSAHPTNRPGQNASPRGEQANSSSQIATGAVTNRPSWKDLQAEFLQYAVEHADLRAVWTWVYTHADRSAQSPPRGEWIFRGGSPGSQHLFKEVARRVAGWLPNPSGAEPWRLWLDLMRAEGYARKVLPTRVPWRQFKAAAESSGTPPLPPGFERQQIENVFKSSADFCLARSLAEMRTLSPTAAEKLGGESGGTGGNGPVVGAAEKGTETGLQPNDPESPDPTDADRGRIRSAWLDDKRGTKGWTSDLEIQQNHGPTYNTIQRYRSGKKSTHDPGVRLKFAAAFGCEIGDVPQ